MTGMKEGAGEDPFADEGDVAVEKSESSAPDPAMEGGSEPDDIAEDDSSQSTEQAMNIPYKFRRDSVQDNRDRVPLFLQAETKTAEREAMRELEERFDDNVSMTDLREALVKVGLEHLDETEATLEEWGYGLTFD
ncbi:hypothetical protein [Halonotius sp. GCM10025705]|uniref:hypothetical protein n=1 Tax=Halonotius sp. GCM10025705 TaxID=3252678 RepID=UPI0036100E8A